MSRLFIPRRIIIGSFHKSTLNLYRLTDSTCIVCFVGERRVNIAPSTVPPTLWLDFVLLSKCMPYFITCLMLNRVCYEILLSCFLYLKTSCVKWLRPRWLKMVWLSSKCVLPDLFLRPCQIKSKSFQQFKLPTLTTIYLNFRIFNICIFNVSKISTSILFTNKIKRKNMYFWTFVFILITQKQLDRFKKFVHH